MSEFFSASTIAQNMRARNKNSASTASTSIGTTSRASPTSTTSPSLNSRRHLMTMSSSMTTSCRLACRRRTSFRREIPATSPGGATQVSQLLIICLSLGEIDEIFLLDFVDPLDMFALCILFVYFLGEFV